MSPVSYFSILKLLSVLKVIVHREHLMDMYMQQC